MIAGVPTGVPNPPGCPTHMCMKYPLPNYSRLEVILKSDHFNTPLRFHVLSQVKLEAKEELQLWVGLTFQCCARGGVL